MPPRLGILLLAVIAAAGGLAAQEPPSGACCGAERIELEPLPAGASQKERLLRRICDEADADASNLFLSTRSAADLRARYAALPADAPWRSRYALAWSLSQALVRIGEPERAAALLEECVWLCEQHPDEARAFLPETLFRLAAAHFRASERDNCLERHNEQSCIFPLTGGGLHQLRRGGEAARAALRRLAALDGEVLPPEAAWLQNVVCMALDDWPAGVPPEARPLGAAFEVQAPVHFVERGAQFGVATRSRAGGACVDDFDGDGRLDVAACALDPDQPLRLYLSAGRPHGEALVDATRSAGLAHQLGGALVVQGDVDNDGRLDLFVGRGGRMLAGCAWPTSLLRQAAPGEFVDVTAQAGVEFDAPVTAACFADVDNDGDLDLFVGCETEGGAKARRWPCRLFLNDGHGRFSDATPAAGVAGDNRCAAAAFGDVDGDGDMDLYVSNLQAENCLYINRGDGVFVDEGAARGVEGPIGSGPCGFFDFDNDGDLDLFVAGRSHHGALAAAAAHSLGRSHDGEPQRLYENDGHGHFVDVADARGLRAPLLANGVCFGDFDADGLADIHVATGSHDLAALFPNVLYRGGARFVDVTYGAGVGHLQKGNAPTFADMDGDGDLDLFCQTGGMFHDDAFQDLCFASLGHGNHWLSVRLVGQRDNRFGLGARVTAVVLDDDGEQRMVRATVGVGGTPASGPLRAFLGLGKARSIVRLEVRWPAADCTQRLTDVAMDRHIEVVQQEAQPPRPQ